MPSMIADILEEHLEELQFLWLQRRAAVQSPRYTLRTLGELERRIEAHVQGLLIGGEQTQALLKPAAAEDDSAFAAAYVLLRFEKPELHTFLFEALLQKPAPGLVEAFCHAPLDPIIRRLRSTVGAPPPDLPLPVLAALAEILGCHGAVDLKTSQMMAFLRHEDPALRRAGWRIARYLPAQSPEVIKAGWNDPDRGVAAEALRAAAWCRQAPLLAHGRHHAARPTVQHWDEIYLLAVLGTANELGHMLQLARAAEFGPARFRALGAFGHPQVIPHLLTGMESKDPLSAVAAGAAFTKITGFEVESSQRALVPPADGHEPDDFEREFLDEVKLPSAEAAQAYWKKAKDAFTKGTRYCRGFDVSKGASEEQLAELDLESRWETLLRAHFESTGTRSSPRIQVFQIAKPASRPKV